MSANKYTIAVVDDHPIVQEGLVNMLDKEDILDLIGKFDNGKDLLHFLNDHDVDMVLLDIALPDINGMDLCLEIKKRAPQTAVLAFSNHNQRSAVVNMLNNGASGYVLKSASPKEIVMCIYEALQGKIVFSKEIRQTISLPGLASSLKQPIRLTAREKEILTLIASGSTTPQIAKTLFLSKFTVENHRKNILHKLCVKNVAELIAEASRLGLL